MSKRLPTAILWYDAKQADQLKLLQDLQDSPCLSVQGHDINELAVDASVPRLFHPDGSVIANVNRIREIAKCPAQ